MHTRRHAAISFVGLALCALAVSCSVSNDEANNQQEAELGIRPPAGTVPQQAPGCTPSTPTDFMEAESWDVRRIEPHDCAIVRLATPVLSWVQPVDFERTQKFTVRLTRQGNASALTFSSVVPRLLVPNALGPGTYEWTVQYTTTRAARVTSQARRFVIPDGEKLLTIPTGVDLANTMRAKPHPRSLPSGASFSTIAQHAASGEYAKSYAGFLAAADAYASPTMPIDAPPQDLTLEDFPDEAAFDKWNLALRSRSVNEVAIIETLGYAYHFTGKTSYRDAAIARLRALASWSPKGSTSEERQDQANREVFRGLASGLDLFDASLTDADRKLLAGVLKERIGQTLSKFDGFARYPYNSHLLTAAQYASDALMRVVGTSAFPEAAGFLASTWEIMITTFGSFGSATDAGYGNGDAYGWYSSGVVAGTIASVKLMANVDLARWPAAARFADNQIALTPPGVRLRGQFGDGVEETGHYDDYSFDAIRLMASATGNPAYEWYWRAKPSNITYKFPLPPTHYLMLGISTSVAPRNVTLPSSYVFEDAGIVAMHTKTEDPARTSVFFRSSRFGSFNHSHADNNAFTFVSKGKELLVSGGYYDYFNSPHHALVNRATRFKNALTFDGGIGQAEPTPNPTKPGAPVFSMDARGRLVSFEDNGTWAVTTGDATLAYRARDAKTGMWSPLLSGAFRTVAFNRRERVVVIYDWARSGPSRTWELNFQTLTAPSRVPTPSLAQSSFKVTNGTSTACVDVYGPAGNFALSSGWPVVDGKAVAPQKTADDQFRARYAVAAPSRELTAVTVIREDCRTVPVRVSMPGGSTANISVGDGAALVCDGQTVKVPAP